jgi:hypothetical protein
MSEVSFQPFKAADLYGFEVQARHKAVLDWVQARPFIALDAEDSLWSFTMRVDGKAKACVGATDEGAIWAFLGPDLRKYMLPLTRYGRSMIDAHVSLVGPVWANIDPVHRNAVKWARLAGFRQIDPSLWAYP